MDTMVERENYTNIWFRSNGGGTPSKVINVCLMGSSFGISRTDNLECEEEVV